MLGGFKEEEDEKEDEQEDELEDEDKDEDEFEDTRDMREDGQEEEFQKVEGSQSGQDKSSTKGPFGRTKSSPPAHALPILELVSSVRCGESEELAELPTRSGR